MARLGLSGHNYAYVFLLDTDGRIRWMSSGQPGDRDVRLLFRATDQLIVEHRQKELRRAKHTGATADLPEYTEETCKHSLPLPNDRYLLPLMVYDT